jgi:cytochrome P450
VAASSSASRSQVSLDVRDAAFLADPYPAFAALRAAGPVHQHTSGMWFLVGFEEAGAGLSDRDFTRYQNEDSPPSEMKLSNPFFLDGPAHAVARRIVVPGLSRRALEASRARAREIVARVLDGRPAGSKLRLVDELGFPLPYLLMCDIFGLPELDDPSELRDWTWRSMRLVEAFLSPDEIADSTDASLALYDYISGVVEWKRSRLGDDLVSAVITATDDGVLSPAQLVPYLQTLYLAGMHTTVHQAALSVLALMRNRDQWDLLVSRPALLENAVEELLRYDSTAQYMKRSPGGPVDIAGISIPGDAEIIAWIGSGNRDEARWGPTAGTLDITRSEAHLHIAFGRGPHACVGLWLARLELQELLASMTALFPRMELAEEPQVWPSSFIRGPEELVLTVR